MRNINGTTTTGDQDSTISNHSSYHLNDIGHLFFVENNIGTSLLYVWDLNMGLCFSTSGLWWPSKTFFISIFLAFRYYYVLKLHFLTPSHTSQIKLRRPSIKKSVAGVNLCYFYSYVICKCYPSKLCSNK